MTSKSFFAKQNARQEPIIQTQEKIIALSESLLEKIMLNNNTAFKVWK